MRQNAKRENKTSLLATGNQHLYYDYFKETIKQRLHIVLVMSPIGEVLRNRIRMFPSIVNCTTIVWYKQWPEEALEAVANKFLDDMQFEPNVQKALVTLCQQMHENVISLSDTYKVKEKRFNYVTPSHYLELIGLFQFLYRTQRKKIEDSKNVYSTGVQRLLST